LKRIPGRHFARNLIERRTLIAQLVRRDFEQRYVGSAVGWVWGAIHPMVLLASYYFIFQIVLKVQLPPGEVTKSYSMYIFCGFLPWLLFNDTVMRSASSMLDHANLITKTVFPAEVVPVSIFLSSLIHHLIALVLVIACAAIFIKPEVVTLKVFLLPLYMFFIGLLGVGVGWFASSLHVYLRDTAQVLTVIMTLWFWATPIMIAESMLDAKSHKLMVLNPMSWIVHGYRYRMLSGEWPSWREIAVLAAYSSVVFVLGGLFFRHLKRGFADVL
jgi:ABC-type polysaccharide/polyol phosphate export permease